MSPHDERQSDSKPHRRIRRRTTTIILGAAAAASAIIVTAIALNSNDVGSTTEPVTASSRELEPASAQTAEADSPATSTNNLGTSSTAATASEGSLSTSTETTDAASIRPAPETTARAVEPLDAPELHVVRTAIDDLISSTADAIDGSPDESIGALGVDHTAIEAVQAEFEATIAEFAANGWSQVGAPIIASVHIVTPPSRTSPTEVLVAACIDNSDVRVVDRDGHDLRLSSPGRSLNLYVLRFVEERWVPAEHTFPDDPDC